MSQADPNRRTRAPREANTPEAPPPPRTLAGGPRELAAALLEAAMAAGVPLRRDRDLVQLLAAVDPGEPAGKAAQASAARVLAFLARLDGEVTARIDAADSH